MARYDSGWGHGMGRRPMGYGHQYRDWDAPWGMGAGGRYTARGPRQPGGRGRGPDAWGFGGYGYGGSHPQYGGYPGGPQRGMYYGGSPTRERYGSEMGGGGMSAWGGFRGWGSGYDRGLDEGYARQPFVPEEAYQRHPEYAREPRHTGDWPEEMGELGLDMDDEEVRQSVRESLFNDSWVKADRIEVEVNGGVVTLTGEVADYMEARYAWDDAWESPGVRGVVNQLTVRTDQPAAKHGEVLPQSGGGKRSK